MIEIIFIKQTSGTLLFILRLYTLFPDEDVVTTPESSRAWKVSSTILLSTENIFWCMVNALQLWIRRRERVVGEVGEKMSARLSTPRSTSSSFLSVVYGVQLCRERIGETYWTFECMPHEVNALVKVLDNPQCPPHNFPGVLSGPENYVFLTYNNV